jgi:hypothetical protein
VSKTQGVELMQRLNDGSLEQAPSAFLLKTREDISTNAEELLEVGARIRPLLVGDRQIGWVRGVHPSERKVLKRWIFDENALIKKLLQVGTRWLTIGSACLILGRAILAGFSIGLFYVPAVLALFRSDPGREKCLTDEEKDELPNDWRLGSRLV